MTENPDNKDYVGLGPQTKTPETNMNSRYLIATPGMLRFVNKIVDNHGTPAKARVLQQYQWSHTNGNYSWYDIPLVEE